MLGNNLQQTTSEDGIFRCIFFLAHYGSIGFSLTVKTATLIFISGCGSTISSAKEGKSGSIYNLVKSE